MGMAVLDFAPKQFTKPLEQMLEAKWPLKTKDKYVLLMDNPCLLLNRGASVSASRYSDIGSYALEDYARHQEKLLMEELLCEIAMRTGDPEDVG